MAAPTPQSMPPPQAPYPIAPPSPSTNIPTQATVMPQYSHNLSVPSQKPSPTLMNGSECLAPQPPMPSTQPYPHHVPANNLPQPPPGVMANNLPQPPPNAMVSNLIECGLSFGFSNQIHRCTLILDELPFPGGSSTRYRYDGSERNARRSSISSVTRVKSSTGKRSGNVFAVSLTHT